jgi:hypothetical protein
MRRPHWEAWKQTNPFMIKRSSLFNSNKYHCRVYRIDRLMQGRSLRTRRSSSHQSRSLATVSLNPRLQICRHQVFLVSRLPVSRVSIVPTPVAKLLGEDNCVHRNSLDFDVSFVRRHDAGELEHAQTQPRLQAQCPIMQQCLEICPREATS